MDSSWFEAMVADVRERPDVYRRLGFADLRLAVEETDAGVVRSFGLVLDGYDVRSVGALEDVEAFHPEVTVAGPREAWDEMFDNYRPAWLCRRGPHAQHAEHRRRATQGHLGRPCGS